MISSIITGVVIACNIEDIAPYISTAMNSTLYVAVMVLYFFDSSSCLALDQYPDYGCRTRFTCCQLRLRDAWQESIRLLLELMNDPNPIRGKTVRLTPVFHPGETVKTIKK